MITFKEATLQDGTVSTVRIPSEEDLKIDCRGLHLLPSAIDPHVHFRIPGASGKEDWKSAAKAALASGVTQVFDMPNNTPSCTTFKAFQQKKALIDEELREAFIPLRYKLYIGADRKSLDQIEKVKEEACGIKLFMGSSTGDLLIDDDATLNTLFQIASSLDMLISVHAEDEALIRANKEAFKGCNDPSVHSKIRSPEAARIAVQRAIDLAAKHGCRLCILHTSCKEELDLIRQAKAQGLSVFAEASPHHLFLTDAAYRDLGTLVQVNPPLRSPEDQEALWEALHDGTVDCIGTDHAPHTLSEKRQPYGKAPSGIPSIDLYLSLLLNAVNQKKLTLKRLVQLTRSNCEKIFRLEPNEDMILVDLNRTFSVEDAALQTKCRWSPYRGMELKGKVVGTLLKGKFYPCT